MKLLIAPPVNPHKDVVNEDNVQWYCMEKKSIRSDPAAMIAMLVEYIYSLDANF